MRTVPDCAHCHACPISVPPRVGKGTFKSVDGVTTSNEEMYSDLGERGCHVGTQKICQAVGWIPFRI